MQSPHIGIWHQVSISQRTTKIKPLIHALYQMHYIETKLNILHLGFANNGMITFQHPIHGSEQSGTEKQSISQKEM